MGIWDQVQFKGSIKWEKEDVCFYISLKFYIQPRVLSSLLPEL